MVYAYKRYTNVQVAKIGGDESPYRVPAPHTRFGKDVSSYEDGDRLVLVYTDTIEAATDLEACNLLFTRHNVDDRPDGNLGPSLSVGDVVVLRPVEAGAIKDPSVAYACESSGWSQVPVPTNIDPRFWVEVMDEQFPY